MSPAGSGEASRSVRGRMMLKFKAGFKRLFYYRGRCVRCNNPLSPLSDPLNGDLKLLTSKANS